MRPNKIKQMWRDGKYVTMGWLSVSHPFTAEVMARQDFDTLCIDMQHGTTDMGQGPMEEAGEQVDEAKEGATATDTTTPPPATTP